MKSSKKETVKKTTVYIAISNIDELILEVANGKITINQVRGMLGLPAIENGEKLLKKA